MIYALIIGAICGWLAGKIMDTDKGWVINMLLGVVGGAVFRFLIGIIGIDGHGLIWGVISGVAGACLLIWAARKIAK